MADEPSRRAVTIYRLTAPVAQRRVRALALDTSCLVWSPHIRQRMAERGFDADDVLKILRTGYVDDDPRQDKPGEWTIKLVLQMWTGRTAGVVTILIQDSLLILKTVEWEDGR